jgi:hypothetical protein
MPSERDQFKRLTATPPLRNLQFQEYLTLAMMVTAKWDRASSLTKSPSPEELAASGEFTEREFAEYREAAARMIRDYTATIAQPKPSWAVPVLQGMVSSFCYTILLITVAVILKYSGIDILGIAELVIGKK